MSLLLLFQGASVPRPFAQNNWPLPKGPVYTFSLRTWLQSPFIGNIPPFVQNPFRQSDWPNPKAPVYSTSLRSHLVSLNTTTLAPVVVQAPFNQTDWPNPKTPQRALQRIDGQSLNVSTLAVPVGMASPTLQFRPIPKVDGFTGQSLALATFAATPLRPVSWPLPIQARRITDQFANNLLGTTLAVAEAPFKPILWPLPVTALYPTNLRTWTRNLLTSTLAPAQGVPFAFSAWTLPQRPEQPVRIQYQPFNLALNGIVTPVVTVPDCGHLYPSTIQLASLTEAFYTAGIITEAISTAGSQRAAISRAGSTRSSASKAGSMKPEIPC